MSDGDSKSSSPAASEQEQEQAKKALHEFERGNYDGCVGVLNKLSSSGHSQDPKLVHNRAVVEYLRSKKVDDFSKSLNQVFHKSHIDPETLQGLEDVDQCVMCYNLALMRVRAKQPHKALALLDRLLQFVEPLEETISRKILFLMVELCLSTQQPERALALLACIDKSVVNGASSNNSKSGSANQSPEKESGKENASLGESWRIRASVYRALCYLMLKSMKSCKRELKSLVNVTTMSLPVTYLKARFEYMRGNYRKAVKILSSAPNQNSAEGYPSIYYNDMAVLHFHMKKPHLAAFYLRKASQEHTTSCSKPLDTIADGVAFGLSGSTRHYVMLYNMGVCLLHCGKPKPAFECLLQAAQVFPTNPRLWLRLAECCIMTHKESNDDDRKLSKRLEVIQGSLGSGVHRKLILGTGVSFNAISNDSAALPLPTLQFAALCLSNALSLISEDSCLKKPATGAESDSAEGQEGSRATSEFVPAPPSPPMRAAEVQNLRCSVLAAASYVALCLSNPLVALKHAAQLLQQPRLSGAHRYLGHMYQAEALVALDRIADAVTLLGVGDKLADISCTFPEHGHTESAERNGDGQEGPEPRAAPGALYPWCPWDLPRAKALMLYNLATAHAIRGEQDKAMQTLAKSTQSVGLPLPAQMYFLKLYLELMEGHTKAVHTMVKEDFGHVSPYKS